MCVCACVGACVRENYGGSEHSAAFRLHAIELFLLDSSLQTVKETRANELEAPPSPRLVVTDGTIFRNPFPEILYGKFYIPQTTHTDSTRSPV